MAVAWRQISHDGKQSPARHLMIGTSSERLADSSEVHELIDMEAQTSMTFAQHDMAAQVACTLADAISLGFAAPAMEALARRRSFPRRARSTMLPGTSLYLVRIRLEELL